MAIDVFLDTSYVIALAAPTDEMHPRAVILAERIEQERTSLVTTEAILLEIGNALSKKRYRPAAVVLLASIIADPTIDVVPLSSDLIAGAFDLFRGRPDKEWGLVDCLSFVVMQARGVTAALTADEHFVQAGFQARLREA